MHENEESHSKLKVVLIAAALLAVLAVAGAVYATVGTSHTPESSSSSSSSSASSASSDSDDTANPCTLDSDSGTSQSTTLADFTVQDAQGNQVTLSSLQGKPVVVGFWASWCPSCRNEASSVQSLYERYGDRVSFMMIDVVDGSRETVATGSAWVADKGYDYPVYFDVSGDASTAGSVRYLPTNYILDAQGNVISGGAAPLSETSAAATLDNLLGA